MGSKIAQKLVAMENGIYTQLKKLNSPTIMKQFISVLSLYIVVAAPVVCAADVLPHPEPPYPLQMASFGVEAIKKWIDQGVKPAPAPGKNFVDTGVTLVTDRPAGSVDSIDTTAGARVC